MDRERLVDLLQTSLRWSQPEQAALRQLVLFEAISCDEYLILEVCLVSVISIVTKVLSRCPL